jgi:hypothetical protein
MVEEGRPMVKISANWEVVENPNIANNDPDAHEVQVDPHVLCVENIVGHTPRVPMQGRMKTGSYYNSPVILLGLVPCNPTRTPAL